jgi:PleD family two-component response regulator
MKYALVLEKDAVACNHTSSLLSSIGYLITPVFNASKALHAAHMIQFDLIVTWTGINPGDRRCLTGELKRCSPDAVLIMLVDREKGLHAGGHSVLVNGILYRPFTSQDIWNIVEVESDNFSMRPLPLAMQDERRRRSIN